MNNFDISATYYKIIGKNNGKYPYKLGLNTLADSGEIFNKKPICGPGGLYFCNIKYIFEYLYYGNKVCILTIPDDAQVVKVGNKYKADQIYINGMLEINYDTIKYLVTCGADITINNNYAVCWAARNGHQEIVKYLAKHGADITADDNYAIRYASENDHLETVKYLAEHGADVTAKNNYAICCAAQNGHLETVKYLVEHGADVTAINNYSIRHAASNGHLETVKYLVKYLVEHGAVL